MMYHFKIDERYNGKKGYPISLLISFNGKTKLKAIKRYSEIKDWNQDRQKVKKSHPENMFINAEIDRIDFNAKQILSQKKYLTIDDFISDLFKEKKSNNTPLIKDFVDEIDFEREKTKELYQLVLKDFISVCGNIPMDEIDKHHILKYKEYKNKLSANAIHTYLRTLRAIYYRYKKDPQMFDGLFPKPQPTKQKELSIEELKNVFDFQPKTEQLQLYKNYACLQFLLAGIDFFDLASLKYDNIKDCRIVFNRGKGGTDAFVSNTIHPLAQEIFNSYDCKPYLLPIQKYAYKSHRENYTKRLSKALGFYFTSKSMRYTFINIAKDINVREDLTMQLVGHKEKSTHSIYKGRFPNKILDQALFDIVDVLK